MTHQEPSTPTNTPPTPPTPTTPTTAPAAETDAGGAVSEPDPTITSTRANPKWLRNMIIYIVLCIGVGIWGLIDAMIVYPNRGARAAECFEFQYLDELSRAAGSVTNGSASIENPQEVFTRLKAKTGDGGQMSAVEVNQYKWLEQLAAVGQMKPENTKFPRTDFRHVEGKALEVPSAGERLNELRGVWTKLDEKGKPPPYSPLSWYDLPSQWLFVAFGFVLGPYLLLTVLRAKAKVYRFEHATSTLTLPGGERVAPADVTEFDKSKWDKVFITLRVRDDHPQLAGKALELDLLRFVPLEEWVLKMERVSGKV